MNNLTIVTAYFEIGRSTWTSNLGFPESVYRPTATYMENFAKFARLKNEFVIFSTADNFDKIAEIRNDLPTTMYEFDIPSQAGDIRDQVELVLSIPDYKSMVQPKHRGHLKYWSRDYLTVRLLKPTWACIAAIQSAADMIAWVDFDYGSRYSKPPNLEQWQLDLDPNRIHIFSYKPYQSGTTIHDIISNNDVYIDAACIIASPKLWRQLEFLVLEGLNNLTESLLVHDDATLILLAALAEPELFKIHDTKNIFEIK